jgi:hypothetical protein
MRAGAATMTDNPPRPSDLDSQLLPSGHYLLAGLVAPLLVLPSACDPQPIGSFVRGKQAIRSSREPLVLLATGKRDTRGAVAW